MPTNVRRPRIYLAGPEVFLPEAHSVGREKCRLCSEAAFEGVFPLDGQLDLAGLPKHEMAQRISRANEALMHSCDALIANVTPFRGVSMDAGTAFEIGFMRALGRPLTAYTNVVTPYHERGVAFRAAGIPPGDSDRPDLEIEDFGLAENLMIEIAIKECGYELVRRRVAAGREMTDLSGFAQCLADLARTYATGQQVRRT
jgi:nucleoside 2-deoxyribosyltransferase